MPTANEVLRDEVIAHQVDLSRYSQHVIRRMVGLLNRTDSALLAEILAALDRLDADSFTVERLELVLASVRQVNAAAYQAIERELTDELRKFAEVEADAQVAMLARAVPEPVAAAVAFTRVDPEQVYAAAMARPFQGRLLREWFTELRDDRVQKRIRDVISIGYTSGETVDQMVRKIKGTRANNYADGILNVDRRHLQMVVRTAVQHVASTVKERTMAENSDIVKAQQWLSTLDLSTTEMCRIRDRLLYENDPKHKPIGHSIPWLSGPGKLHWGCRSTSTAVLKSLAEITGLDIPPDDRQRTRASMDGQVPADTTYGDWLQRQSAERQDEVVGPTRGKLMRAGKLPFDKFYSERGDYLTLDELRERVPKAFERAGV